MGDPATAPTSPDTEISELSYEEARSALVEIVARLEQGSIPLEDSLALWERGEALARHCQSWLDGARKRLQRAQEAHSPDKAVASEAGPTLSEAGPALSEAESARSKAQAIGSDARSADSASTPDDSEDIS
ncbi:exodeoxyribonuclease VII small subunit [Actinomycetaceae bacterium L2_0104]